MARSILANRAPDAPARVLFLEDGIRDGTPVTVGLATADDSRKGGSIQYGMWTAASRDGSPDHVIAFTDADPGVAALKVKIDLMDRRIEELRETIAGDSDEREYGRMFVEYQGLQQELRFRRDLLITLSTQSERNRSPLKTVVMTLTSGPGTQAVWRRTHAYLLGPRWRRAGRALMTGRAPGW